MKEKEWKGRIGNKKLRKEGKENERKERKGKYETKVKGTVAPA
jgi:hypothetical protein